MNPIIESLNRYAAANRWSVDGGPARNLSAGQLDFPVLWYQPLALTGKTGRGEGCLTYRLTFLLLDKADGGGEQRQAILDRLETHALGIVRTLENHRQVREVRLLDCRPAEAALTHYGETALRITIEADVLFCHTQTPAIA